MNKPLKRKIILLIKYTIDIGMIIETIRYDLYFSVMENIVVLYNVFSNSRRCYVFLPPNVQCIPWLLIYSYVNKLNRLKEAVD